ncbi:hypothetical protein OSTOST_20156 [Ostertagia ostertagi]
MTADFVGTAVRAVIPGDALYSIKIGDFKEKVTSVDVEFMNYGIHPRCSSRIRLLTEETDSTSNKTAKVVEVLNHDGTFTYQVPFIGAIVTAKVVEISDKNAKCTVFRIEDTDLQQGLSFSAVIRKEDMRTDVKLDQFKVRDCMLPGDYVIASVISTGDSHYLLSIADSRLGVVAVKSPNKNLWLPPMDLVR